MTWRDHDWLTTVGWMAVLVGLGMLARAIYEGIRG